MFFANRPGLRLDDNQVYPDLLKLMGTMRNGLLANSSLATITPIAVHEMGIEYFGGYKGTIDELMQARDEIYDPTGKTVVSVSEFSKKGIAVCAERAPLAHNMLVLLGYRSFLVYSDKCLLDSEDNWGAKHVFNIFLTDNSRILFEPTNFTHIINDEGKVVGSFPALSPISTKELEGLRSGEKIKIVHNDLLLSSGGFYPTNPQVRIYQGPSL